MNQTMSATLLESVCVICRTEVSDVDETSGKCVKLTDKGLDTLEQFCELRGDLHLQLREYLLSKPTVVKAHVDCRKRFTNKRRYEQEHNFAAATDLPATKALRSGADSFDWKRVCFICGKVAVCDDRHSHRGRPIAVRTLELRKTLLDICSSRNDSLSLEVKWRLNMCCDLVAVEAIYHKQGHKSRGGQGGYVPPKSGTGGQ